MAENDLADVVRRLAAIEERLVMGQAAPMDRLSGTDLRLDAMQNLMQAIALTQNQHTRQITEIQTTLSGHDRRFDQLDAGIATITQMLTTIINQGQPGEGA